MGKVRIYGTIGPACKDKEIIKQMFQEGMDGVRLNLSHTSLEEASALIDNLHKAARECDVRPELLIDMQGPELRIGYLKAPIMLPEGDLIETEVIPFPAAGCAFQTPAMTENDRNQLKRAKDYGVTAVMQPFVRSREDLIEVRSALDRAGCEEVRLLAKIENTDGVSRIKELIPHCDEIVIARGDLGNAMDLWELPAVQKHISAVCREAGRDFMVVTQMLDSMMHRQVPTRAEVSDIFNAVADGASSVMVTGETAAGDYPALAIRYLYRTVREAEKFREL